MYLLFITICLRFGCILITVCLRFVYGSFAFHLLNIVSIPRLVDVYALTKIPG